MANQKPQVNLDTKKPRCDSYLPGHQVHWIQARVKRSEPRYDATVEFLDETRLRISWLDQSHIFQHHNIPRIKAALDTVVLGYVKFAPTADLLYVQSEEANDVHGGAFSISYLARGELKPCSGRGKSSQVSAELE